MTAIDPPLTLGDAVRSLPDHEDAATGRHDLVSGQDVMDLLAEHGLLDHLAAHEVPTGDPLRDSAIERFFTASEHEDVVALRDRIVDLGAEIDRRVPAGRNKALALTALEDVQMRGNRGLFAPEHLR